MNWCLQKLRTDLLMPVFVALSLYFVTGSQAQYLGKTGETPRSARPRNQQTQNPPVDASISAEEKPLGDPQVVVIGNLGVVKYSSSILDNLPLLGRSDNNVICFSVHAIGDQVANGSITSSGLGSTEFGLLEVGMVPTKPCPTTVQHGATKLALPVLRPEANARIWMSFPRDLIATAGDSVEGKILVVAPQKKNLEVPIKVQAPTWSPFFTALLWSVGIIIPAIVTFVLGLQGNKVFARWQLRSAEFGKLNSYINENYAALKDVFTIHLQNALSSGNADFPNTMRQPLLDEVWKVLPGLEAEELRFAIARCQRDAIKETLADLFPDWRQNITGKNQSRLRRRLSRLRRRLR